MRPKNVLHTVYFLHKRNVYSLCIITGKFIHMPEVSSEINLFFKNYIVIEGKLAELFCLFLIPTCFILQHINTSTISLPPGTEPCHRSRWGPFQTSSLPLLPSAPICPSHCNHSSSLLVRMLGALKPAHSSASHTHLTIMLHCFVV